MRCQQCSVPRQQPYGDEDCQHSHGRLPMAVQACQQEAHGDGDDDGPVACHDVDFGEGKAKNHVHGHVDGKPRQDETEER